MIQMDSFGYQGSEFPLVIGHHGQAATLMTTGVKLVGQAASSIVTQAVLDVSDVFRELWSFIQAV